MKRTLLIICLLILAGCNGSGGQSATGLGPAVSKPVAGILPLELQAQPTGDSWLVELSSPAACDLYQIAGGIHYDQAKYTLVRAESGGDLGDTEKTYFAWGEATPGLVEFAYTKRFYGKGIDGAASLMLLEVTADHGFNLADFSIDTDPTGTLARDSHKEPLEIQLAGEVR